MTDFKKLLCVFLACMCTNAVYAPPEEMRPPHEIVKKQLINAGFSENHPTVQALTKEINKTPEERFDIKIISELPLDKTQQKNTQKLIKMGYNEAAAPLIAREIGKAGVSMENAAKNAPTPPQSTLGKVWTNVKAFVGIEAKPLEAKPLETEAKPKPLEPVTKTEVKPIGREATDIVSLQKLSPDELKTRHDEADKKFNMFLDIQMSGKELTKDQQAEMDAASKFTNNAKKIFKEKGITVTEITPTASIENPWAEKVSEPKEIPAIPEIKASEIQDFEAKRDAAGKEANELDKKIKGLSDQIAKTQDSDLTKPDLQKELAALTKKHFFATKLHDDLDAEIQKANTKLEYSAKTPALKRGVIAQFTEKINTLHDTTINAINDLTRKLRTGPVTETETKKVSSSIKGLLGAMKENPANSMLATCKALIKPIDKVIVQLKANNEARREMLSSKFAIHAVELSIAKSSFTEAKTPEEKLSAGVEVSKALDAMAKSPEARKIGLKELGEQIKQKTKDIGIATNPEKKTALEDELKAITDLSEVVKDPKKAKLVHDKELIKDAKQARIDLGNKFTKDKQLHPENLSALTQEFSRQNYNLTKAIQKAAIELMPKKAVQKPAEASPKSAIPVSPTATPQGLRN